jgi:hypothetical protein
MGRPRLADDAGTARFVGAVVMKIELPWLIQRIVSDEEVNTWAQNIVALLAKQSPADAEDELTEDDIRQAFKNYNLDGDETTASPAEVDLFLKDVGVPETIRKLLLSWGPSLEDIARHMVNGNVGLEKVLATGPMIHGAEVFGVKIRSDQKDAPNFAELRDRCLAKIMILEERLKILLEDDERRAKFQKTLDERRSKAEQFGFHEEPDINKRVAHNRAKLKQYEASLENMGADDKNRSKTEDMTYYYRGALKKDGRDP